MMSDVMLNTIKSYIGIWNGYNKFVMKRLNLWLIELWRLEPSRKRIVKPAQSSNFVYFWVSNNYFTVVDHVQFRYLSIF